MSLILNFQDYNFDDVRKNSPVDMKLENNILIEC